MSDFTCEFYQKKAREWLAMDEPNQQKMFTYNGVSLFAIDDFRHQLHKIMKASDLKKHIYMLTFTLRDPLMDPAIAENISEEFLNGYPYK